MLSRRFLRRLPRAIRWLWFAIVAVVAAELALLGLGLWLGGDWLWAGMQLASILAGPLAVGLVVVLGVAYLRPPRQRAKPSEPSEPPAQPDGEAGRRAGQAVLALARSREGRVAIRRAARLVRAVQAATRPPPDDDQRGSPQ